MADDNGKLEASRADEIADLKRQMEEMQKRLDALCSVSPDAPAGEDAACEQVAGDVHAVDGSSSAEDDGIAGESPAPVVAEEAVSAVEPGLVAETASTAQTAPAIEDVPAHDARVDSGRSCDDDFQADAAYTAAAVADFMPQSAPPQPAPPVYGAPGYAQPGQPPAGGQQVQAQPGYQSYAQQPGQTAYCQQSNAGYYSTPQGGYTQPQGGYQAQYQQPLVRTKDHVAAGLLAIFLGVFGVHKFYLGYNTAGFILLGVTILGGIFTLGIAASVVWLIGIIEGVMYLTKSQPEFEQLYIFNKREWF